MTTSHSIRTAFLDTNTLVHLFDFWKACETGNVNLDGIKSVQDLRSAWVAAGAAMAGSIESRYLIEIKDGIECFVQLRAAKEYFEFFTCRVCQFEMYRTILNVYATEGMIKAGVPFSIRNKRPLLVYRRGLEEADYDRLDHELKTFFEAMHQDYGIYIKILEDPGHGPIVEAEEIFAIAEILMSRILMETMDAYIYGAAIACRAHCLLTFDFSLRQTANQLSSLSGRWGPVVRHLLNELGNPTAYRLPPGRDPRKRLR